ncbi:MAG: integration host factor subunit beta [Ruminococcus sp.]|nr:integration host factor subunit beta [Ruminococcus sp.]
MCDSQIFSFLLCLIQKKLRYLHCISAKRKNWQSNLNSKLVKFNKIVNKDMTKADIVNEISRSTGLEKAAVLTTIEKFMETVKETMANGENVYLRGFGSFILKTRKEKTARNISKNTTIIIPEHKIPAFKPAKTFLEDVR